MMMTNLNAAPPASAVWLDVNIQCRLKSPNRQFLLDVQFQADAAHRRVALFGPSGAGKSATLLAIAGLSNPSSGHVQVNGQTLFDKATGINTPTRQRRMGFVFQHYALFAHMTVWQNLAFAARRLGQRLPDEACERMADLLRQFDIAMLADSYPRHLSGGQQQRLALARALVNLPQVLLLDEPFAALDTALRLRLRDELAAMLQAVNIPVILVTHDESDLKILADKVVRLDAGRVVSTSNRP